jgi:hypothetical protein
MKNLNKTRHKPAIVVIGDINVDMLGRVKAWPKPGQDCLAPQLEMHCGGVGANSALALARWGVDVRLAGCAALPVARFEAFDMPRHRSSSSAALAHARLPCTHWEMTPTRCHSLLLNVTVSLSMG